MKPILYLTLILGALVVSSLAQSNSKTGNSSIEILLNKRKPSAFITFEKFSKRTPEREGESSDGIWLRFHNNTKWKLYLKTLGAKNGKDEHNVSYEVRRIPGLEWQRKESELPIGYRITHKATIRAIESGKSILFSIPKENLADGLAVFVGFSYEWELLGNSGGNFSILHEARFWSTDLPSEK